jgi:hypothetical protein
VVVWVTTVVVVVVAAAAPVHSAPLDWGDAARIVPYDQVYGGVQGARHCAPRLHAAICACPGAKERG